MPRMTRERCHVCGASWTQEWLEPVECPNGCDEIDKEDDTMDEDTPRTNAAMELCWDDRLFVDVDFARKMEREHAELQRKHDAAYKAHCDLLTENAALKELYKLDTDWLRGERDEARVLIKEWEDKARSWMASPEAAQRLECYRELTAENETLKAANSDVRRIAMERNEFERENAALKDALRVRIKTFCDRGTCGSLMYGDHSKQCHHAETERKVMQ